MAFFDPITRRRFLYWGGDSQPIFGQRLRDDLSAVEDQTTPLAVLTPDSGLPYERLVEGPFVCYRGGRYYLFYSGDDFAGAPATYAVLVARSDQPLGPFHKLAAASRAPTSAILERSERWEGPGHASVFVDRAGNDWLAYHAIDAGNRWIRDVDFVRRPMLIDRLFWRGGWPSVRGGTASSSSLPAPASAAINF